MPDGRLFVTNKGRERFKVLDIVHSKPIMVCKVEVLPEEGDEELTEVGDWRAGKRGRKGTGRCYSVIHLQACAGVMHTCMPLDRDIRLACCYCLSMPVSCASG